MTPFDLMGYNDMVATTGDLLLTNNGHTGKHSYGLLTLSLLMMTQAAFVDSADQDQTAQDVQSDL